MKLIASDYDGTFRTDQIQLKRNIEAAKRWRQAGNLFGIVTGRSIEMIWAALVLHHIPVDFLICNNGASLYDSEGTLLATETLCLENHLLELLGVEEMLRSFHYIFITTKGSAAKRLSPLSWIEDKEFKLPLIQIYEEIPKGDLIQISTCFSTYEEAAACAARVNELFGEVLYANLNQDCVDIAPVGVDKCVGVQKLLGLLPEQVDRVLTIGDGENDISMIHYFDGASVEGAPDVVKKEARRIYPAFEDMIDEYI